MVIVHHLHVRMPGTSARSPNNLGIQRITSRNLQASQRLCTAASGLTTKLCALLTPCVRTALCTRLVSWTSSSCFTPARRCSATICVPAQPPQPTQPCRYSEVPIVQWPSRQQVCLELRSNSTGLDHLALSPECRVIAPLQAVPRKSPAQSCGLARWQTEVHMNLLYGYVLQLTSLPASCVVHWNGHQQLACPAGFVAATLFVCKQASARSCGQAARAHDCSFHLLTGQVAHQLAFAAWFNAQPSPVPPPCAVFALCALHCRYGVGLLCCLPACLPSSYTYPGNPGSQPWTWNSYARH
jgi:hypothetical protein